MRRSISQASTLPLMKGCCSINKKQKITLACFLPVALAALFYAGGYIAQFIYNYQAWTAEGGTPYSSTSPPMPAARALLSLITPLDVETIAMPRPFITWGMEPWFL